MKGGGSGCSKGISPLLATVLKPLSLGKKGPWVQRKYYTKGISPLLATVLLIAATVVTTTMLSGWVSSTMGTTQTTIANRTSEGVACAAAEIIIDDVYSGAGSNSTASVIVRNSGNTDNIAITSAQFYDKYGNNFTTTNSLPTSLNRGQMATLTFRNAVLDNTTSDSSGRGNTGTLGPAGTDYGHINDPAWTSSGKYNTALIFDGNNDYVNVADSTSLNISGNITMMAWVKGNAIFYGNGSDGSLTVNSSFNLNINASNGRANADAVSFGMTMNISAGSTSFNTSTTPNGLAVGDEIMIINLRGTSGDYNNVGEYETRIITAISGNQTNFTPGLTNPYDGSSQDIMVQRVPHYSNVTVLSSGIITANSYSTSTRIGGVIFFRAINVNVTSGGVINATGRGYAGGAAGAGNPNNGKGGITYNGVGGQGGAAGSYDGSSGQGGGGGAGQGTGGVGGAGTTGGAGGGGGQDARAGGGGGGYGDVGNGGQGWGGAENGADGSSTTGGKGGDNGIATSHGGGGGGGTYGSTDLSQIYLGSGGGAPGRGGAGTGGNGGGIVFIAADSVTVNGSISANGADGTVSDGISGGGGGAGGSIHIKAATTNLGSSIVTAAAGSGGSGSSSSGGNGGVGRIRLDFDTLSGSPTPVPYNGTTLTENVIVGKPGAYGISADGVFVSGSISGNNTLGLRANTSSWTNVAMTFNSTTQSLFVDGILKTTSSLIDTIRMTSSNLVIGFESSHFNGTIDDVAVWNRSLTNTEINTSMNQGPLTVDNSNDLMGYWKFDLQKGILSCPSDFSRVVVTTSCGGVSAEFSKPPKC